MSENIKDVFELAAKEVENEKNTPESKALTEIIKGVREQYYNNKRFTTNDLRRIVETYSNEERKS